VDATDERLTELLAAHGATLRRIAWAYAGATGEEDDLHQEILLQLWRALPSFRGDAAPGTWLYRVALNTAISWRRSATRRANREPVTRVAATNTAGAPPGRSELAVLEEFMGSLGPVDRTVLILYMEGLASAEIADVTGLAPGAVAVRVHRMKQRFERTYVEL
jgi:RNA polymerase sigma-70 factor, ECF subfamily